MTRPGWLPRDLAPAGPRYQALLDALERDIRSGDLAEGQRLPPRRDLALQLGLSVGTVSKAYYEAEQLRLISAHVGQGTFVRRLRTSTAPKGDSDVINLALNVPAMGAENDILSSVFSDIARPNDLAPLLLYGPHAGVMQHRAIIADWMSDGILETDPSRLFICNGAQQAIDIALRLVARQGDSILVDELTYSGFKAVAAANRQSLVPVTMDHEGVVPEALEAAHRATGARVLYVMPTLQSPTARTMSVARRKAIAALSETLDLWIIEDDVYGFFYEHRPAALASLVPDRTLYITSYSKCVAPGFRLGTLSVPAKLVDDANVLLHAAAWFASSMLSEVLVRLIEDGRLDALIAERRRAALERFQIFKSVFRDAGDVPCPPFFAWLPLPRSWSANDFVAAAQTNNILVTPPASSSVASHDPAGVRICLGSPRDGAELGSALHNLAKILEASRQTVFSVA